MSTKCIVTEHAGLTSEFALGHIMIFPLLKPTCLVRRLALLGSAHITDCSDINQSYVIDKQ
ncbi:hypothetical protein BK674_15855 [Pseudomonas moraviensis]|uniref:Uncharacterized protein n=1 Tax=Pseudomonas moraviensis TaxID=321662 RepID=A0A423NKY4_9PSED|nr:hypothetical protein BK674_15855 [Pseudomonas moraviensis]